MVFDLFFYCVTVKTIYRKIVRKKINLGKDCKKFLDRLLYWEIKYVLIIIAQNYLNNVAALRYSIEMCCDAGTLKENYIFTMQFII